MSLTGRIPVLRLSSSMQGDLCQAENDRLIAI
jgi:hypothetical protein